jgi:hypothetical protein
MSGLDERPSPLIANNVFYNIFRSIRIDWLRGVNERGQWLLEVLPHTSIEDREEMEGFLGRILQAWEQRQCRFKGARWVRDGPYCYMTPEAWMINWECVDLLDPDGRTFNRLDYEEIETMYNLWRSGRLTWRAGE